ncbi:IclR family transcriptional regulator [Sulfitobacter sp. PR48]|uniref:IclR family transcriptional regulator n=1 Tax=unclassified Sulfitobacter TaxID=196795 RepID=UPI0022AE6BB9|nr:MULTISPECIES: IclR family transcriptional regulator [unclassified Sulfitobacter]MCZ4256623.1 IclR family transcriptional regulator [Sulfitobacter sp. G21635-S1]MDD9720933.1 IclR family transcriptional regulator [Sulfitobacter sp. PR48]
MATPLNGSLIKAFEILDLLSEQQPQVTSAEVASALEMSHSTAHRFLNTLEEVGALVQIRRGVYGLGHHIAQLGRVAERTNPLARLVQPVIARICGMLNESVMVGALSRDGVVCIATAIAPRPISVNIQVGRLLELHQSAQGKVWLAHMDVVEREARLSELAATEKLTEQNLQVLRGDIAGALENGFACNRGESEPDIGAVAVPVFDADGALRLTLSAFGMASRFSGHHESWIAASLTDAARDVAEAIPGR